MLSEVLLDTLRLVRLIIRLLCGVRLSTWETGRWRVTLARRVSCLWGLIGLCSRIGLLGIARLRLSVSVCCWLVSLRTVALGGVLV
jgi:hypothetical protein